MKRIFVNGAKGVAALQLSRDLDSQYKIAFVLAHKLREAMAPEQVERKPDGIVEIDGRLFRRLRAAGEPQRGPPRPPPNREPFGQAPVRGDHAPARRPLAPVRRSERDGAVPHVHDRVGTVATSLPTKAQRGMRFTWVGIRAASITASASWMGACVPIRRSHILAGSAAPALALTIISSACTSPPMPANCHGARIIVASAMAIRPL
jgi:hypothetical protein